MLPPLPDAALAEITTALYAGRKISAIKAYRTATGAGLADAKNEVEAIERVLREAEPEKFTAAASKGGCAAMLLLPLLAAVKTIVFPN